MCGHAKTTVRVRTVSSTEVGVTLWAAMVAAKNCVGDHPMSEGIFTLTPAILDPSPDPRKCAGQSPIQPLEVESLPNSLLGVSLLRQYRCHYCFVKYTRSTEGGIFYSFYND